MKFYAALLFTGITAVAQQSQDVALLTANSTINTTEISNQQVPHSVRRHENVVKPVKHQNEMKMVMSTIGMQYAFLATPKEERSYLSALSLPLMKIAFEAEGRPGVFEKIEYHTLVKIELLANANGTPGTAIACPEQMVIVTNKITDKQFDVKLATETALPEEGYFVQLTIMGRCNANGNLLHDRDFIAHTDKNGNEVKWMENCQPNFPLTEQPKGTLTFYKNPNMGTDWHTINTPHLSEIKKYQNFNIGFGYTTVTYK